MSTAIVPINHTQAVATINPEWESKLDLIRRTVAVDATNDELQMFFHQAKKCGLDPLARQIYFVKRKGKGTIQVGIDGYRLIADRTGKYAGNDDPEFDDFDNQPKWAKVTVYKIVEGQRCPFTATARWKQYFPGDGPQSFAWSKMPHLMLGKCAEALALRKAFPAELSGVYTAEEMHQADVAERPGPAAAEHEGQNYPQCERCKAAIINFKKPDGTMVPWSDVYAQGMNDHEGKAICGPCQVTLKVESRKAKEASATTDAPAEDVTPDPMMTKDLQGKLVIAGTITEIKDGKPFVIFMGKERIATFSASVKDLLKDAQGKKVIFEYTEVEKGGKLYKNIVDIRRVGDQEYDGGVPVTQLNQDLYVNEGETR